jgi:hypothetical protein
MNMSAPRPSSHGRVGGDFRTRSGSNFTAGSRTGDRHRWSGSGNHHRWHHRRHHYRPRYYSYYPFGYGIGYGYPFWGASTDLYYNGYHPQYYSDASGNSGGSVVQQVQQELANGGFYRGPIDGVIGNGTRSAIRSYERANGLRVDGRIDAQLLGSMGLS